MGKSIFDLIFPDSETTDEYLHSVITNQNGRFSRTLNISATGTELTCDWYNTIVTSENGDFVGLTSLIDDVTLEQSAISKVEEKGIPKAEQSAIPKAERSVNSKVAETEAENPDDWYKGPNKHGNCYQAHPAEE